MPKMFDDGGAAFPIRQVDGVHPTEFGMSLRDWFAGMAMQGILSGTSGNIELWVDEIAKVTAAQAYRRADAMIAEKRRTEKA